MDIKIVLLQRVATRNRVWWMPCAGSELEPIDCKSINVTTVAGKMGKENDEEKKLGKKKR